MGASVRPGAHPRVCRSGGQSHLGQPVRQRSARNLACWERRCSKCKVDRDVVITTGSSIEAGMKFRQRHRSHTPELQVCSRRRYSDLVAPVMGELGALNARLEVRDEPLTKQGWVLYVLKQVPLYGVLTDVTVGEWVSWVPVCM